MYFRAFKLKFLSDYVVAGCQTIPNNFILEVEKHLKSKTNFSYSSSKAKKGTWFSAIISGCPSIGKITKEKGRFFLCQNECNGQQSSNRLGFKYNWIIGKGRKKDLYNYEIGALKIHKRKPSYPKIKTLNSLEGMFSVQIIPEYIFFGNYFIKGSIKPIHRFYVDGM